MWSRWLEKEKIILQRIKVMKKIFTIIMVMTLMCLLTGCDSEHEVLLEKYDELVSQYDSIKKDYEDVQAEYDALKEEYKDVQSKYDELETKYDTLNEDYFYMCNAYKSLYAQYNEIVADDAAISVSIKAIASVIDENSHIAIFDGRVIHIMVSYFEGVKEKVEEFYPMIVTDLTKDGYESCIVSVIDEDGKCLYGWTIYKTGESDPLLSR